MLGSSGSWQMDSGELPGDSNSQSDVWRCAVVDAPSPSLHQDARTDDADEGKVDLMRKFNAHHGKQTRWDVPGRASGPARGGP